MGMWKPEPMKIDLTPKAGDADYDVLALARHIAETQVPRSTRDPLMGAKIIGGKVYKPDASPTNHACARCGRMPAAWIAGAGEALCSRHQHDY